MRVITTTALLSMGLMSACGLGDDPQDPKNPIDPPQPPAKRNVEPLQGGGTYGGLITNELTVFVLGPKGQPLKGALVRADLPGASGLLRTDKDGRVDFYGGQFAELLALHAIDDGHQYSSLYGVRASVVTFQLSPVDSPATALVSSTLTGTVSGWSMLPERAETLARVANVFAVGDEAIDLPQPPRPGTVTPDNPEGTDSNLLVDGDDPFPRWLSYRLEADRRASALAVLAGTFDLKADPAVKYTHLGVRLMTPDLMTETESEAEGRIEGQDIEISHALDQQLEVILSEPPELDHQAIHYGLRLGEAGTVPLPEGAAPLLTDALAEASYHTAVRFWSEETIMDAPRTEILAEQRGLMTSFTYGGLLLPPEEPRNAGMSLAAQPSPGATMLVYTLTDASKERLLWKAIRFGDHNGLIELPESDQTKVRVAGARLLTVTAVDLGALDLNDARFDRLDQQIRSMAISRTEVWF